MNKYIIYSLVFFYLIIIGLFVSYNGLEYYKMTCNNDKCINPIKQCINNIGTTNYYAMNCEKISKIEKQCIGSELEICTELYLYKGDEFGKDKPFLIKYWFTTFSFLLYLAYLIDILIKNDKTKRK